MRRIIMTLLFLAATALTTLMANPAFGESGCHKTPPPPNNITIPDVDVR